MRAATFQAVRFLAGTALAGSLGLPKRNEAMQFSEIPGPAQRALDLLIDDHRTLSAALQAFEDPRAEQSRRALIEASCQALAQHAQIESHWLYPGLIEQLDNPQPAIDGARAHEALSELLEALDQQELDDEALQDRFEVLAQAIREHIRLEEEEIFDAAVDQGDELEAFWQQLGEQILARGRLELASSQPAPMAEGQTTRNASWGRPSAGGA
jgi:hemerythrin-like domain-containing protein